jgi:hypothetical protein
MPEQLTPCEAMRCMKAVSAFPDADSGQLSQSNLALFSVMFKT